MSTCSREIPDKGLRNRWPTHRPDPGQFLIQVNRGRAARKSFEPDPVRTGVGIGDHAFHHSGENLHPARGGFLMAVLSPAALAGNGPFPSSPLQAAEAA